ncbi:TerB family tellurite resistance protein [Flavisolibacter nicotianae]|uniref:TerB family tellurite resistance protein n=1 Tax=Flavisolibacter nicotianae TaxID=2364882 RepID=UPI000EB15B7C|nr:TerB family tellurite resistance protein [Flavisolibacter nicotianae]
MKKCVVGLFMMFTMFLSREAHSQAQEVQQLLLNVEKLAQLKNILEDLKKGYEIVSQGYSTIKNLSQGNFNIHEAFLDGLLEVSSAVRNYRRITDIVSAQISLVKEYKAAYRRFASSGFFSVEELTYMKTVFENLFNQSVKNIEALIMVITDGKLRMSDDERLTSIDAIWKEASDQLTFLRHFNQDTKLLALQRAKASADAQLQKKLFSINK